MLPSHTSNIIIILHICAYSIMITSSYLLSKSTNSRKNTYENDLLRCINTTPVRHHENSRVQRLFNGNKVPLFAIYGLLYTATEPDRLQTSVRPRHNWRCCMFPGPHNNFRGMIARHGTELAVDTLLLRSH